MIQLLFPLLLCAVFGAAAEEPDALRRLETDSSSQASARLDSLYGTLKNPDQRFWVVQALGVRLREKKDERSLKTLIRASKDDSPGVRAPALRALTAFQALPKSAIGQETIREIQATAEAGSSDVVPAVRDAGLELKKAVLIFKNPAERKTPAPPADELSEDEFIKTGARWSFFILFPLLGAFWAMAGLPIFDPLSKEGRLAAAAWEPLLSQKVFIALCSFLWTSLIGLVGGSAFYSAAAYFSGGAYEPPSGWAMTVAAAGLAALLPGMMSAAGFSRKTPSGTIVSFILSFPASAVLSFIVVFVLFPVEAAYRIFFRAPFGGGLKKTALPGIKTLEAGSARAAYQLLAVSFAGGFGLLPAMAKSLSPLEDGFDKKTAVSAFDPRFVLLCAGGFGALLFSLSKNALPALSGAGWPAVLIAGLVWMWAVCAVFLWAVLQPAEGVLAAARAAIERGASLPREFDAVADILRRDRAQKGENGDEAK